jgi:hypothetical protein
VRSQWPGTFQYALQEATPSALVSVSHNHFLRGLFAFFLLAKTFTANTILFESSKMSETPADHSHRFPSKRSSVKISSHAAQLLFAVILLGLDAYGIRFVAYSGLVYTLLVVSNVRLSTTSYSAAHSFSQYVPS